jgi:hypothetical protein
VEERVKFIIIHVERDGVISMHLPIDYIRVEPDFMVSFSDDDMFPFYTYITLGLHLVR